MISGQSYVRDFTRGLKVDNENAKLQNTSIRPTDYRTSAETLVLPAQGPAPQSLPQQPTLTRDYLVGLKSATQFDLQRDAMNRFAGAQKALEAQNPALAEYILERPLTAKEPAQIQQESQNDTATAIALLLKRNASDAHKSQAPISPAKSAKPPSPSLGSARPSAPYPGSPVDILEEKNDLGEPKTKGGLSYSDIESAFNNASWRRGTASADAPLQAAQASQALQAAQAAQAAADSAKASAESASAFAHAAAASSGSSESSGSNYHGAEPVDEFKMPRSFGLNDEFKRVQARKAFTVGTSSGAPPLTKRQTERLNKRHQRLNGTYVRRPAASGPSYATQVNPAPDDGVMEGSGLALAPAGYVRFGAIEIDKRKLEQNVLSARYCANRHKIPGIPNMQVNSGFRNAVINLLSGYKPDVSALSQNEISVLNLLVKTSQAKPRSGGCLSKSVSNERMSQVIMNRISVLTGEQRAGNDSVALRNELSNYIRLGHEFGCLSDAQARTLTRSFVANV